MALNEKIASDIQQSSPGKFVVLYKIDATQLGGGIFRFISATKDGSTIYFNSLEYLPIDIECSGFEQTNKGTLPRPKLKLSNVAYTMLSAVLEFDDLVGAVVTRKRTFEKYLDGESEADPLAKFSDDIFVIEKKTAHNKYFIEWELSAYMDFEGKFLPNRQIIRDTCVWRYRVWDDETSSFDYSNVQCPYTGSNYFKKDGTPTATASEDVCGKRLSDCDLRYGNDPFPFSGFPGVGKLRIPR